MSRGWERAIARVLGEDGRPEGAAFLIAGGFLLTCSHVVADVLGLGGDAAVEAGAEVTVDFPLAGRPGPLTARVRVSTPIGADMSGDLAVLELASPPPEGIMPMRLSAVEELAGHRWRAFGFPVGRGGAKDAGVWSTGVVEGREGTGWLQLRADRDAAFVLAQGFSGGPIFDEELGAVVGIVVTVEADAGLRTGYALTVESVERDWPDLRAALVAGNPYRDLSAFAEGDASVFFGREAETTRLVDLVERESAAIVPVLGASGVGKSSLVNAGLVARLRDSGRYLVARIPHGRRYSAPELVAWALLGPAGPEPGDEQVWRGRWQELSEQLGAPGGLEVAVDRALAGWPEGSRLLLVADQFEGLLAEAPETAGHLDALLGALTARRPDGSRGVQAVVVARIDFLRHLEAAPHVAAAWDETHVVIPPLTRDQLRAVAADPLEGLGGVRFADGLLERILEETPPGAAGLPLLEFTLAQLWREQSRGELTAAAYHALGGVGGALAGIAERSLFEWADKAEEAALERIFIQLVRPGEVLDAGERSPDTRRVAESDQFGAAERPVLARLSTSRLVVTTRQPAGAYTVELAHEALIRAWPRLAEWVERNREFRTWQEQVRAARRAWAGAGRDRTRVLGPGQVQAALEWMRARPAEVGAAEREFVEESRQVAARRRRRRRGLIGALVAASLLGASAAVIAGQQHDYGVTQQQAAFSREFASRSAALAGSNPNMAKQLAVAAYQSAPTAEAFDALIGGIALPGIIAAPAVSGVEVSDTVIAMDLAGKVELWSRAGHEVVASLADVGVSAMALSADGEQLALGTTVGAVAVWDIADPARPVRTREPATAGGSVLALAFSPDASLLAAGESDGRVLLWPGSGSAPEARMSAGSGTVWGLAFSPDGGRLAAADQDGGTSLWDLSAPASPRSVARMAGSGVMRAVAFSPDGRELAATGADQGVRLWNVSGGGAPKLESTLDLSDGGGGEGDALVFSRDGNDLFTATSDQGADVNVWNLANPDGPATTLPDPGASLGLALSPDGTLVALAQSSADPRIPDDEVKIWDVANLTTPGAQTLEALGAAASLALSPDGSVLAESGFDGVGLWDASDPAHLQQLSTLPDPDGEGENVAISGHLLAVGSIDAVTLFDITDPARPVRRGAVTVTGGVGGVVGGADSLDVTFSPRGDLLVARDEFLDSAWIIGTADPARPTQLVHFAHVPSGDMSFSADDASLAIAASPSGPGGDEPPALWDVRDPAHPAVLAAPAARIGPATALDFAPGASLLAAATPAGGVGLWRTTADGAAQVAPLPGGGSAAVTVRFSADGRFLAEVEVTGAMRMWDVSKPSAPVLIGQYVVFDALAMNLAVGEVVLAVGPPRASDQSREIYTDVYGGDGAAWTTSAAGLTAQLCGAVGDLQPPAQLAQAAPGASVTTPCRGAG
ncbi:trypsin-like peptidase domain-containing protein [Actinospica robiniae]|uniref:nSTAND1 domain-containing NTPase n=1 Tax=Actinospica robiniae TaxID=304901 RepID=UPI00041D9DE3|nr:trypsin-like peptidase domain-containing protein [Actinospica robiniae]